jgi:hypothetical protein
VTPVQGTLTSHGLRNKKIFKEKGHFIKIIFLINTYQKEYFLKISKHLVEGLKKYLTFWKKPVFSA